MKASMTTDTSPQKPAPEPLPFPQLVRAAIALVEARPEEVRVILGLLEPYEGHRLHLELLRIARGKTPPRLMSQPLRELLPLAVEGLGPPAVTLH
jgi:hypothetical protein